MAITRIAVTGAAGHLGSHLIPLLLDDGYDVVGIDMIDEPEKIGYRYVQMNLADDDGFDAFKDVELIVHVASLHPWKTYSDETYIDANIKGTWRLYNAASRFGIRKIVMTSSIAAVGYHSVPTDFWPVTEEKESPLGDLYSLTKNTQEQIARHFGHLGATQTLAIRPPAFMPKPMLETGFLLTGAFCIVDDIASAHLRAIQTALSEKSSELDSFEAFFTVNNVPYTRDDAVLLEAGRNVKRLVQKYWPSEYAWLEKNGYSGTAIPALYDMGKAASVLGWTPLYNFEQWATDHIT